jgi:hypothetical protein
VSDREFVVSHGFVSSLPGCFGDEGPVVSDSGRKHGFFFWVGWEGKGRECAWLGSATRRVSSYSSLVGGGLRHSWHTPSRF